MQQTFSTQAIILDRQNFRENDLRVVVYTKDKGKLELVAKGAKKSTSKVAAHIEPLNLINVMIVKGKQFDYIGSATSKNCFANVKNNLDKISIAGENLRILNKFIKTDYADVKIFYLLKNFLLTLNKEADINILSATFKLKLISLLGYKPELHNCVHCNKKTKLNDNKFSLDMDGLICLKDATLSKNCLNITNDCIKLLRSIVDFEFDEILKIKINNKINQESANIINSLLRYKATSFS